MYIIGLTGGIASGKSSIAGTLSRFYGAWTLDIDKVTRWLLEPGGALFEIYVRHFGIGVVDWDGELNRRLIGEIIFNDPAEREWINSVSHPMLLNYARDFLVECSQCGARLVVLEVPLLFKAGWENLFDEIWAVTIKRQLQIRRLMSRDNLMRQQAKKRINAQMHRDEICSRADVVILNKGKKYEIRQQIFEAMRGRIF